MLYRECLRKYTGSCTEPQNNDPTAPAGRAAHRAGVGGVDAVSKEVGVDDVVPAHPRSEPPRVSPGPHEICCVHSSMVQNDLEITHTKINKARAR